MKHINEPVHLIPGGASILWSPKSEIHADGRTALGNYQCLSSARLPKGGQRRKYESTLIDYIGGDSYGC